MSNLTLKQQEQNLIPQFERVLDGSTKRATAFVAQMLLSLKRLPKVQQLINTDSNAKASYMSQMIMIATAGLSPDSTQNQTATIRFKDRISVIVMYQGYIMIARQNGIGINAQMVYEKDSFENDVANGQISHEIFTDGDRGNVKCFYAVAKDLKTGRILNIKLMTLAEAKAHGNRYALSRGESSPWRTNFNDMALKTVVRKACTSSGLSYNSSMQTLAELDEFQQGEIEDVEKVEQPTPIKVVDEVEEEIVEEVVKPAPQPTKQPSQPAPTKPEEDEVDFL